MAGYQYLDLPFESTDQVVMCPQEFDLSTFSSNSATIIASSIPCWINPYGSVPAYGALDYNRSTGSAVTDIQVASVSKVFYIVTTDIVISSGTFTVYWGNADLATSTHYYQINEKALVNASRGAVVTVDYADFTASEQIYDTKKGVTVNSAKSAGGSATGKLRMGFVVTRKKL